MEFDYVNFLGSGMIVGSLFAGGWLFHKLILWNDKVGWALLAAVIWFGLYMDMGTL